MSKVFLNSNMKRLPELRDSFGYEARKKNDLRECPVCRHNSFKVMGLEDRYGFPQKSVVCMRCSAVYLTPRLTDKQYGTFYARWYHQFVSAFWMQAFGPRRYTREQMKYSGRLGPLIERYAPAGDLRLLDVGGSIGIISNEIKKVLEKKKRSARVTVVDPSKAELKHARILGHETVSGLVEHAKLDGQWDIILVCLTIDHLLRPREVMLRLRELLTPTGILYVDFVNFPYVLARRGPVRSIQLDHTVNFNETMFLPWMGSLGFKRRSDKHVYTISRGYVFGGAEPVAAQFVEKYPGMLLEKFRAWKGKNARTE